MRRTVLFSVVLGLVAVGAWSRPPQDLFVLQEQAFQALPEGAEYSLSPSGVPRELWHPGKLRQAPQAEQAAIIAAEELGPLFRLRGEDGFAPRVVERDELGQEHVRLQQTYRGLKVVGGELIVHMDARHILGVNGQFVPEIDLEVVPRISEREAIAAATSRVQGEGGMPEGIAEVGEPVVYAREGVPFLALPVLLYYSDEGSPHLDIFYVDAVTGEVKALEPRLFTAKYRTIYNLNQKCIYTGSELPGTFMFSEGGSSSDQSAMGAYNGAGTTYDFYKNVFGRDSYDGQGAELRSSVHAQFSTGFFGCTKNNAAWIDTSNIHQMAYGDGDGSTLGDLARSLDVTAHELTHGVTSRTANLAYQNESGALNEAVSDILGRATSFWAGQGNPTVKTDWTIGADVYTPNQSGDALRYMYDPKKDGQSADYYPERNYASGCSPSSSNDYCGVHTNSGIANLAAFLMSYGGTHPRGKTSVSVPGFGVVKMRSIWYRALTVYMTSSTNFQGARDATARAAADLYGGQCSDDWKTVQLAWDAVGVPGTWSCSPSGTYSISGNAGTSGATVTAGSYSATSDASGNYTITGLPAGTYTVTPSKSGCTFTPSSRSVTVGPNATGINFTASCGSGGSQLLQNPGFEQGAVAWTASSGVIENASSPPPRSGSWKAYLNGYGFISSEYLYQDVTIPSNVTSATLSFWLWIRTQETSTTTAYDKLWVQIRRPSDNALLKTLAIYSNLNKTSTYVQKSFDVSQFKGQTVRVYFYGAEDASLATGFLIDDTSLTVQ
ncbi:MAG: M4 family metallopeptidase [Thermoanaerobaculum sp.]